MTQACEPANKTNDSLVELAALSTQAPFDKLCEELSRRLQVSSLSIVDTSNMNLGDQLLNCLQNNDCISHLKQGVTFKDQGFYEGDARYYEQIIFDDKSVPTRANFHDFFNGLIWQQFPRTKSLFNKLHQQEIAENGTKKRSKLRDKLTHFDECGLVILSDQNDLGDLIANHQWEEVFVKRKDSWHQSIQAYIFGHAMWEMMMLPFIGLTAKVLIIRVDSDILTLLKQAKTREKKELTAIHLSQNSEQGFSVYSIIDDLLVKKLSLEGKILEKRPFLPLPILGIPGWSTFEQNHAFYQNDKYFMPLIKPRRQTR